MKNISIWKNTITKKQYPKLDKDLDVDCLIIGGGITGISTLYHLNKYNLNVVLVEQNEIGMGVTANSTGKLSYLQNDLIDKIRKSVGDKKASKYLKSQIDTINKIVDIVDKENIDCDLEKVDSCLYTNNDKEIKKIKELKKFLKKNNIEVSNTTNKLVKSKYMIKVDNTYIYHPIKFCLGLLKSNKYPVYEHTSIQKILKENDQYICYTKEHKIKAKWVVLSSHYPYFILPYLFPIKASLEKSYLSASKYDSKPVSLISYSNPFISIRNYQEYLIYLTNSHSINKHLCDKDNFNELMKKLNDLSLKPEYLWSNIDIITNDGLPYIGEIKPRMLIGTGYNTWGLTNGFLAGMILSDMINNKPNQYINLFMPHRMNLKKFIGSFSSMGKSISGLLNGYLYKSDKVIYRKIKGKKIMMYNQYKVFNKCPHFGCNLVFNEIEKTWDCPCHGSRFNIDGTVLNGPSNKDISINDL